MSGPKTRAKLPPDLCVIGAGAGGLAVAAGAVQMGASVVLVERGEIGGDCLNVGCVPSKSLIAAARLAHQWRRGGELGIAFEQPRVDFAAVGDSVERVIKRLAPHDSVERFESLGVKILREEAKFIDPRTVRAGSSDIRARRFVIATGSSPAIPPIPGLDIIPYFTNETIFANRVLPGHLVVIGGGAVGIELAQAHRRLGAAARARATRYSSRTVAAELLRSIEDVLGRPSSSHVVADFTPTLSRWAKISARAAAGNFFFK